MVCWRLCLHRWPAPTVMQTSIQIGTILWVRAQYSFLQSQCQIFAVRIHDGWVVAANFSADLVRIVHRLQSK
jgi:hypothetical protein